MVSCNFSPSKEFKGEKVKQILFSFENFQLDIGDFMS